MTVFLSSGLDVSDSSQPTHIILKNVSRLTNGQFKCEVSGDAPRSVTITVGDGFINNTLKVGDSFINKALTVGVSLRSQ